MSGRRIHIRKCKDGSYRVRIYHVHGDQVETLQLALEAARKERGTDFDAVALDGIIMGYLASATGLLHGNGGAIGGSQR